MNSDPWFFDKFLVILEEPTANKRIPDMEFKEVAFWIRLMNLPIGYRSKAVAEKIGNSLGTFLEFDEDKEQTSWGISMKLRLRIDTSKPLKIGFMLKAPGIKDH